MIVAKIIKKGGASIDVARLSIHLKALNTNQE
jgi:hypothetical protein